MIASALAVGWGGAGLDQRVWAQNIQPQQPSPNDTAPAQTDDFQSPLLGFFEAGVLCAQDGVRNRDAPNTIAGSTRVVTEAPAFISAGRMVPAVLGVGFGVRAGLTGDLSRNGVTMHISHPPLTGSGVQDQSFITTIGSEFTPSITFYQFDEPYELALGDWTMTARLGAVTLYETTFTVVTPDLLPDLADACGYLDLLS